MKLVHLVLGLCLLFESIDLSSSALASEAEALLRFREHVELDPDQSLRSWKADDLHHCNWFGVECSSEGRVVALRLKDLGLKGTLVPELGNLRDIRIIDLQNNFFTGVIPPELGRLVNLEVLDLRHNNLEGLVPSSISNVASLRMLLLEGNDFEISQTVWNYQTSRSTRKAISRKILLAGDRLSRSRMLGVEDDPHPEQPKTSLPSHQPQTVSSPPAMAAPVNRRGIKTTAVIAVAVSVGVAFLLATLAVCLLYFHKKNVETVTPWATGLSGQLQKAFTAGVPSLGRPQIEAACEQFSNVIGTLPDCTLYKGTLSSGVEITVVSASASSAAEWPDWSDEQFLKKISALSKVNHKNFLNLLGYCKDDQTFSRMMVFEYAPCGTLFEHLHVKEMEPLSWAARLRIAMGVIYCLEYMDTLSPPVAPKNLSSSSIYITEDLAAKISDIGFWTEKDGGDRSLEQESVVYKFGILLLELISSRLPFSEDDGLLVLWASSYLTGKRPLNRMLDSTLASVPQEDITALCDLIRSCISPELEERPAVADVARRMREITAMRPDDAIPKNSPLWWAELEISSSEAC